MYGFYALGIVRLPSDVDVGDGTIPQFVQGPIDLTEHNRTKTRPTSMVMIAVRWFITVLRSSICIAWRASFFAVDFSHLDPGTL